MSAEEKEILKWTISFYISIYSFETSQAIDTKSTLHDLILVDMITVYIANWSIYLDLSFDWPAANHDYCMFAKCLSFYSTCVDRCRLSSFITYVYVLIWSFLLHSVKSTLYTNIVKICTLSFNEFAVWSITISFRRENDFPFYSVRNKA